jgi:RNA polymerase sigma-70 factor (ECF subfamily)
MFRIDELPQKRISECLGISVSGVEKLLQRAYRQIYDAGADTSAEIDVRRRLPKEEDRQNDR